MRRSGKRKKYLQTGRRDILSSYKGKETSANAPTTDRGIALLSVPGKVFNRIILGRLKNEMDPKLRDQQAGFRRYRSCADHRMLA